MPQECWHNIAIPLTSLQQLWVTMGDGIASTSTHHFPSLQTAEGAPDLAWRAETSTQCAGCSWSIYLTWADEGRMSMEWLHYIAIGTPTMSPTAVGNNGWPCFHLNTQFQADRRGLIFGLVSELKLNRMMDTSGAQCQHLMVTGCHKSIGILFPYPK